MDVNEQKKAFLEAFKELGYRNKACKKLGMEDHTIQYWKKTDAKFAMDYQILQEWWKEEKKERIEEVMYDNAMIPRGFMDRMAWLRKHYPEEYDPKRQAIEKETKEDILKDLKEKLEGYKKHGRSKDKNTDSGTK